MAERPLYVSGTGLRRGTGEARVYGHTVLIGCGVGMWIQASFSVAQALVEPRNVAPVIGFVTLAQFLGNTTAMAIANAIFLNGAEARVQAILPHLEPAEIQAAIGGVSGHIVQSLEPSVRNEVLDAIVASVSTTYILVMAAGSLVAVLSLFVKTEELFVTSAAGGGI